MQLINIVKDHGYLKKNKNLLCVYIDYITLDCHIHNLQRYFFSIMENEKSDKRTKNILECYDFVELSISAFEEIQFILIITEKLL